MDKMPVKNLNTHVQKENSEQIVYTSPESDARAKCYGVAYEIVDSKYSGSMERAFACGVAAQIANRVWEMAREFYRNEKR